jgi:hypothetical protein
MKRISG